MHRNDGSVHALSLTRFLHPLLTERLQIHLAIGAWGIFAYTRGIPSSRMFARGLAVLYAVLAIMGFIPGFNTMFGLVPLYGNDVWLHALLALVAAYYGWVHRNPAHA